MPNEQHSEKNGSCIDRNTKNLCKKNMRKQTKHTQEENKRHSQRAYVHRHFFLPS